MSDTKSPIRVLADVGAIDRGPEAVISGVGVLEECEEEILLVLEVRIHGSLGETGGGGNLVEGGRVEPPLSKDLGGRLQQVLAGLLAAAFCGERLKLS